MAELEKLQLELQEAVRESEKLKVEMFSLKIMLIYFRDTSLFFNTSLSSPDSSDGLAEYSRRGSEGDTRVQMSAVPVLPAVQ